MLSPRAIAMQGLWPSSVAALIGARDAAWLRAERKASPDESDQRRAEFEALIAKVKEQAVQKAAEKAQKTGAVKHGELVTPQTVKPPRMPDVRGVEPTVLKRWMPDLLMMFRDTYRTEYVTRMQDAAAQVMREQALRDDDEVALLALML